MNTRNFEANYSKASGILFLGIILLIMSIVVILFGISDMNYYIIFIGTVSIILFGKEVFHIVNNMKVKDSWIVFSLTDEGINDVSLSISPGIIRWDTISKIKIRRTFGTEFLAVYLIDWKEISAELSILKCTVMYFNVLLRFAPINIAINRLDIKATDILEEINNYRTKLESQ